MKTNIRVLFFCLLAALCMPIFAQTHTSVPLDNRIYQILEQAEIRGLCSSLSGVRPYTQSVIVSAIQQILDPKNEDKINRTEREILEQYLKRFSIQESGLDKKRGAYTYKNSPESILPIVANIGVTADIEGSTGVDTLGNYWGTETWFGFYVNGDLGNYFSFSISPAGGLVQAPRKHLGQYNTYYETFDERTYLYNTEQEFVNQKIDVYGEPLTHFPYSYKKRWDSSVFFLSDLASFDSWPNSLAGGYSLSSEVTGSFLENRLILRIGRLSHEWGAAPLGSSLALNKMARPFFGVETEFNPASWFSIASMTGSLEYENTKGIYESPKTFQNFISITKFQLNLKNHIIFEYIDAAVWPKRFELGYMSPITNNFFYQNNIGKFDNMAMTFNLKVQDLKRGSVWASLFLDEAKVNLKINDILTLDRQMFAIQAGTMIHLPFWSFSSVKISYTKINPYTYTHHRNYLPWYGDSLMEKAYVNNGVGLGYYIPPNSDEILMRLETMPTINTTTHFQYQLIRHGADFGSSAVDGSNLLSELDPYDRSSNPVLRRYFLQDGAYQWFHIIRLGGIWNLEKQPVALLCEIGTVISYFTNIEAEANITGEKHPYSVVNTAEYPKITSFIVKLGVKIFPRW